jgi:NADP-dependent 3-hydroxy acid dehydrogenase YdfG
MSRKPISETIVLITGASNGIGLATVSRLAELGYKVIATARAPEKNPEFLALAHTYENLHIKTLDVTDPEEKINELIDSIGDIDILINNAGIGLVGVAESFSYEQITQLLETNVIGVIKVTNAVLPGMRERNAGRIITLSSIVGPLPDMRQCFYSATKAAVEHYTVQLANDLREHEYQIDIANIHPGPVITNFEASTPVGLRFQGQDNPYPQMHKQVAAWRKLMKEGRPVSETVDVILRTMQAESVNFWNPTEMRVAQSFARVYNDPTGREFTKGVQPSSTSQAYEIPPEEIRRFNKPNKDIIVFITGASSGIGLEAARAFCEKGYHVVATARCPERSTRLLALQKIYPNLVIKTLDVTDTEANIKALIDSIGPVDILINNAGVGLVGAVESYGLMQIRRVIATNLLGLVKLTFAVLPSMRSRNEGMILSLSSIVGPIPSLKQGIYSGSKAMAEHFTAQLRNDLTEAGLGNIVVANIHPGAVLTNFANATPKGERFNDRTNPYYKTTENIDNWRRSMRLGRPVEETINTIMRLVHSRVCNFWNPTEPGVAENFARVYKDITGVTFAKGPIFSDSVNHDRHRLHQATTIVFNPPDEGEILSL